MLLPRSRNTGKWKSETIVRNLGADAFRFHQLFKCLGLPMCAKKREESPGLEYPRCPLLLPVEPKSAAYSRRRLLVQIGRQMIRIADKGPPLEIVARKGSSATSTPIPRVPTEEGMENSPNRV